MKPKKPNRTQTKKTQPNRKKPSQTDWTGFYPKKPNRNRSVWTGFGFVLKFFFRFGYFFLIKTESNRKWSPLRKRLGLKWDEI
jgi:hypothetical protein